MAVVIDGLKLDAAMSESHRSENEITQYPVEEGANVTDHVLPLQDTVTITGIVSNTPVVDPTFTMDGMLPTDDALAKLRKIKRDRKPVTLKDTTLGTYEDMVMESLEFPRDGSTGDALRFVATFRQIVLITNERTTVPVEVPVAAKKKNLGHKSSPDGGPVKLTPELEAQGYEDTTVAKPRAITHNGKAATLDPKTYFGKSPGGTIRRIPTATGGG